MHEVRQWSSVYHPRYGWGTVTALVAGTDTGTVDFDEDPPDTYRYVPVAELTHVRDWQAPEPDGPDPITAR